MLSRPLPSPELAPNVRARWSEAKAKVVLPRCAAKAERSQGLSPTLRGTWRTPESLASQRCASGIFAAEDRATSTIRTSAARIPAAFRPGGRCVPHCNLEPREPSPDPDYRGVSHRPPWCSVSLRRLLCCFRRERWPGSDPGGGRTRAAQCGEL